MSVYVSKLLRNLVIERAGNRCEYCRIPRLLSNLDFHIEHIIGIQHGGLSSPDNLAWCCSFCNWKKGPNIATILNYSDEPIPLFHPRKHNWFGHFDTEEGLILPQTKIGEATANLLELNLIERVEIRSVLVKAGFYP